jgi:hypothetical protein
LDDLVRNLMVTLDLVMLLFLLKYNNSLWANWLNILRVVSGVLFTMELYCTMKSKDTTVRHSQQLFEHTYTSNLYDLGTLTPIEFSQQDLLWQSSNTHSVL